MSPFIRYTQDTPNIRFLISGPPGFWKTTALLTTPAPRVILSAPGEKQFRTIPTNDPETIPLIWQMPEGKRPPSRQIVKEVREACYDALTGKQGKIQSFCFDGVHKFFDYIADEVTDGAWFGGGDFEPKVYAIIYRECAAFFHDLSHTQIPVLGATVWAEYEGDRPARQGEKASDIPRYLMPALPGKMAMTIMGEFPMIFAAVRRRPTPDECKVFGYTPGEEVVMWQTSPGGEIKGCGLRGEKEVVKRIPKFVPADFKVFMELWTRAEKAIKGGA